MRKAAVIPCKGIGDGLIMMVAAYALYKEGYEVTVYHPHLASLKDWFFPVIFTPWNENSFEELKDFDKIIIQNDNSPFIAICKKLQETGYPVHVIYPTFEPNKHKLTSQDIVLTPLKPIASEVAVAMRKILGNPNITDHNGLVTKPQLIYRKHRSRVILHPTSTSAERTWSKERFRKTYKLLEKEGYEPVFIVGPFEIGEWEGDKNYRVLSFPSLSSLGDYVYESGFLIGNESGLSHLASNLLIPTLVIAGLKKRILQWQPSWGVRLLLYPPSWIPNPKILRLRDRYWQKWISAKRVSREFFRLVALFDELK